MNKIHIRGALKVGWSKLKERFWYLSGLSALALIMMMMTTGEALYTALSYIVLGGFMALMISHHDGRGVTLDDLFDLDKRWIYFAFASVLKGLLILGGLLLFIIPGIYLAMRFYFVELLVLDKGMRPMEALRASSELTMGHKWKLLLYTLIVTLVMLLGMLLLVVGIFPAMVLVTIATIHIYRELGKPLVETQEG